MATLSHAQEATHAAPRQSIPARAWRTQASLLQNEFPASVSIPNPDDVTSALAYIGERSRGIDPTFTVTCTPPAGPEYLFEIEVTAYRGAGELTEERLIVAL